MTKNYLRATAFTVFVLFRSVMALANTAITSGNWETGANWSTGVAPIATDAVTIPAGLTMTITATGDVCASLNIAATGSLTINANESLSIGGNFTNAGTFNAKAGSTLTFNGTATSVISGGGTYTIAATIVMNMGSTATVLDVQDTKFIAGINSGSKYYFTFIVGTWKEDNTATLADSYNSGSNSALTIPYGVVIESDAGTINLCRKANSGNAILSGKLFVNGGTVNVQTGQSINSGQDFRYAVVGGTPQLYVSSGTMYIGAGFNANSNTDFIDFHMTGGTIIVAEDGYSNWITFQLADVVGGMTFMSAGTIILQDACNAAIEDLDMGGANVALTQYSVTGGTVQIGYAATQASSTFFGINAEPATNYPNIDFEAGTAKTVSAWVTGNINMLSLYVNPNMTFDATGFSNVNIMSNNGTFALKDEGGFVESTNTITFSGSVPQLITSSALINENFYNLTIANTSGHVILGVNTTVNNQLSFTSGLIDATTRTLTLSNGSKAVTGASQTSYVITGNGFTTLGNMNITGLPTGSATPIPIGTASYYLPASITPASAGTSYSAYVFTPATTNARSNGAPFSAPLLANMLNAVWNIGQTAGSGSGTLALNWTPAETVLQGSVFSTSGTSIGITQYNGAAGWSSPSGTGSIASTFATSSFASFSQFAITDLLFVLPVAVYDFNAVANSKNTVLLTWSASDAADISQFEVQRSTNGSDFNPIGTVQAIAGSDYSFTDTHPAYGVNYYRLLIQNADGSSRYSAIKTVDMSSGEASISVYPIPATTTLNVSVGNASSGISVRLMSATGQILQTTAATNGHQVITMDIGRYPAGTYIVQVIGDNKVLQTTPMTKL